MKAGRASKTVGRPREFDADEALEIAMRLFWQKGYEGTSLTDLTEAIGINRPSLYAAFGNKEELFRKALNRYAKGPGGKICEALAEPDARKAIEGLLLTSADCLTDPRTPSGCMAVQSALSCGDEAEPIRKELCAMRAANQETLTMRLEQAKADGDLSKDADACALSAYFTTVLQGMAVQAAGGASRKQLREVAKTALRAWPS